MTGTLISLISIFIGIIAANLFGLFKNKYSFGFTGNTLIGVFGSILLIKSFGRLGFNPWSIMNNGDFNSLLLTINLIVSALGGVLGLVFTRFIYNKMNK
ncbi:hypothetical protein DFQ11_102518 [Winogradskyella epiphytica]|uniref:Membrane protein YeaQ/YmgE (Transglycosylase-associated protein family) n=1 Tax=Winogradskyella epiphytica TaxID=262005 RepID=A0A2V4Y0K0_9FLAO|nr:hypothetical protein [Winogradskyella epiphytica]PYE81938.1 hypothetical protein DFQ11_102518 [Winogradskyella epiphytica]GGW61681.1 hypothetical protein GCM10008085_11560 [Winogradskyella epiphytica]